MNYFEMFDLPITYAIDEDRLTSCYLQKQKALYVDSKNSDARSMLNAAYDTLSDPIKRAEYFLKLHKYNTDISTSSKNALEMFSIREKFDSLKSDIDRKKFFDFIETRIGKLITLLPTLENDLDVFHEKFEFILFMYSFLEKVRTNVYCGN